MDRVTMEPQIAGHSARPKCSRHAAGHMLVSLALVMGVGPVQGWSTPPDGKAASSPATPPRVAQGPQLAAADPTALGVSFVEGSSSSVIIERNGKKYLLDLATQTVREVTGSQDAPAGAKKLSADPAQKAQAGPPTPPPEQKTKPGVYEPGDDFVFSLPTGRRLNRHGFYINFNHRFAFNPAFEGKARGHVLLGLDDFSISSFGFRYGVTKDLSVGVYRSPSVIGRPIQFTAGYHLLDEHDGGPFNAEVRVSVEGQNDFSKNFTGDFEGIFSRSLTGRAQIYIVPTFSVQNRPLVPPQRVIEDPWPNLPGFNTFALGVGGISGHPPDGSPGGRGHSHSRQRPGAGNSSSCLFVRDSEEDLETRFYLWLHDQSRDDGFTARGHARSTRRGSHRRYPRRAVRGLRSHKAGLLTFTWQVRLSMPKFRRKGPQ